MKPGVVYGRRSKCGVTLVEVVVAMMILAASIGGLCRLVVIGRNMADQARYHYTAINMAKNRLERIKTFPYDQLDYFAEAGAVVNYSGVADGAGDYRRTTSVSNAAVNLKEVAVTVRIRNKETRSFDDEGEVVRTYVANFMGEGG